MVNRQTVDDAETTLTIQGVIELDLEEGAADVGLSHKHDTATTAKHCTTDRQVDRLAR